MVFFGFGEQWRTWTLNHNLSTLNDKSSNFSSTGKQQEASANQWRIKSAFNFNWKRSFAPENDHENTPSPNSLQSQPNFKIRICIDAPLKIQCNRADSLSKKCAFQKLLREKWAANFSKQCSWKVENLDCQSAKCPSYSHYWLFQTFSTLPTVTSPACRAIELY